MKLRTHLLIANGLSIGFILVFLIFSYLKMILALNEMIWLFSVTITAGIISFFTHMILTRPIQKSIQLISLETKKVANGEFKGKVPIIGPLEFRALAENFNEMSEKVDKSFSQLQQSESSRRELVANISHDLRTPLSSIRSFVEALQDDIIKDHETVQRYLGTIQLETRRLNDLIEDLFQLSQLESGMERFIPESFHLDHLILESLQNQYFQLQEKNIDISVDIPDRISPVAVMPDKLKRVLINLIQNAIRYSPAGGQIAIKAYEQPLDFVKVIVSDDGDGISPEELPYVFDRFYRVDKSRNRDRGGAGLGLSIAKSIIQLHGGEIGVDSQLGKGSSFWFAVRKYPKKSSINIR